MICKALLMIYYSTLAKILYIPYCTCRQLEKDNYTMRREFKTIEKNPSRLFLHLAMFNILRYFCATHTHNIFYNIY